MCNKLMKHGKERQIVEAFSCNRIEFFGVRAGSDISDLNNRMTYSYSYCVMLPCGLVG